MSRTSMVGHTVISDKELAELDDKARQAFGNKERSDAWNTLYEALAEKVPEQFSITSDRNRTGIGTALGTIDLLVARIKELEANQVDHTPPTRYGREDEKPCSFLDVRKKKDGSFVCTCCGGKLGSYWLKSFVATRPLKEELLQVFLNTLEPID